MITLTPLGSNYVVHLYGDTLTCMDMCHRTCYGSFTINSTNKHRIMFGCNLIDGTIIVIANDEERYNCIAAISDYNEKYGTYYKTGGQNASGL